MIYPISHTLKLMMDPFVRSSFQISSPQSSSSSSSSSTSSISHPSLIATPVSLSSSESRWDLVNGITRILSCGMISGLLLAGCFNPWDRALYLSVKNNRKFLDRRNFKNPFAGVFQTLTQRSVAAGLYFPLEDAFRYLIKRSTDDSSKNQWFLNLLAGAMAGSSYGLLMNPMSAIKYHYWGKDECGKENFLTTAMNMYRYGGVRLFFVGTAATVLRDLTFGAAFTLLRHDLLTSHADRAPNKERSGPSALVLNTFTIDVVSASAATILSSPFNYVRDMHYSSLANVETKTIYRQLCTLMEEVQAQSSRRKSLQLLQRKLRLGWGTARVGCGMAVGSYLYSQCSM